MHSRMPNKVTRKWFRVPSEQERQRNYGSIAEFVAELDVTTHMVEPPDVASMEWRAYSLLTIILEKVALPIDRYRNWIQYGDCPGLGDCGYVLAAFKISHSRRLAILSTLSNIEPYPSRKPVERHQIGRILQDAGVVPVG